MNAASLAGRALCAALLAWPLAAAPAPQTLTVSAAASLGDAMREIARSFEAARLGVTLRLNLAASGVLLQQIARGAPLDVFASADTDTVERGLREGLLEAGSRRNFAANALVLVVPVPGTSGRRTPDDARTLEDLRTLDGLRAPEVRRIAIGKWATVPAGRYAREALESAGLWMVLQPRLVQADSVRQVLDYVARGEVDAGFVYRSDAAAFAGRVRIAADVASATPIRYPAAVVSESQHKALAREFVEYLLTPAAQATLARHGFAAP